MAAAVALTTATACGGGDTPPDSGSSSSSATAQFATFTHNGVELPRSKTEGPQTTTPFPRGYSHTAVGAALAAANTTVVLDTAPDDEWGQLLAALAVHDAGYTAWSTARQQVSVDTASSSSASAKIAGYQIVRYAPDSADVAIFTTYPDGSHTRLARTVRWQGDDWKLLVPDPNATAPVVSSVDQLPAQMVAV